MFSTSSAAPPVFIFNLFGGGPFGKRGFILFERIEPFSGSVGSNFSNTLFNVPKELESTIVCSLGLL